MIATLKRLGRPLKQAYMIRKERSLRNGVNLNVGSGSQQISGFISLDLDSDWYRERGRKFLPYNMMTDILPFSDEEVDNIYVSHVIEHLPNPCVSRFFEDAYRVLRPSGVLRIATPDAAFLWNVSSFANDYWRWRDLWFRDPEYSTNTDLSSVKQADYYVREVATPACRLYTRKRVDRDYDDSMFKGDYRDTTDELGYDLDFSAESPGDHINSWDFAKVRSFGEKAGFRRVIESKWRGSVSAMMQHPDFDRTCPNMSLYVDLVK